ncbi:ATP synthase mitochondrial F1 complex assembly factor 2 [Malassezia yamatoensis]|uniref:ATP synthase mitochondrial F1 complex assembly factor 2 n=1 Tax=Malassezia yamatoensis TaxID=253288 RepID=A0AAJ6CHJ2_9BASI|nr:ATP synthase mitochondrial F1 complex assembly factor 2 [Malassezia yamatoensis]
MFLRAGRQLGPVTKLVKTPRNVRFARDANLYGSISSLRSFGTQVCLREAPSSGLNPLESSVTEQPKKSADVTRFWKDVSVGHEQASKEKEEHFTVLLDKRALRTPGGHRLEVPADHPLLACLIAEEWDTQTQVLKPHSLPLTSLMARAIDGLSTEAQQKEIAHYLMRYFDTDAITFHEEQPDSLLRLQNERWNPIIAWAKEYFQMDISVAHSALSNSQPAASRERVLEVLEALPPLELACMERAAMTTKSMITSLAMLYKRVDAEQASLMAEVETASQVSVWGAVEDSHDVDHAELRRQLASVSCALTGTEPELVAKFVDVLKTKYSS